MLVMKFLLKAIYESMPFFLNRQESKKIYTSKTKPSSLFGLFTIEGYKPLRLGRVLQRMYCWQ